jgi:hypothetical protein
VNDNKPEYAGRVRQVKPNVLPVRGTIHSYHTPSEARSQILRQGTYSQEYVEQAIERAIMTEWAEWEARFRAFESRVNARISEPVVTQQIAAHDRAFEPGLFRSLILTRYESFILCVNFVCFTIFRWCRACCEYARLKILVTTSINQLGNIISFLSSLYNILFE